PFCSFIYFRICCIDTVDIRIDFAGYPAACCNCDCSSIGAAAPQSSDLILCVHTLEPRDNQYIVFLQCTYQACFVDHTTSAFHMAPELFDACLEASHRLCLYTKIIKHYRKIGDCLLLPGCDEKGNMIIFRGRGETFHIGKQFVRRPAHRTDHNNEFFTKNCPVPE